MPKLVLIKHSLPEVQPGIPAARWLLGDEGRARARALGDELVRLGVEALFSSREPKAIETAAIAGGALALTSRLVDGLHEHLRDDEPFRTAEDFAQVVRAFFARPDDLVFGEETASQALGRFSGAVEGLLAEAGPSTVAIVAHGTVISLFVASKCAVEGHDLWQRLGLPSYAVLETQPWRLVEVREQLG